MKRIIFITGGAFLSILFICASSIATASISNNNIGSIATGSNSNSSSILSDNSGAIGAESDGNAKPNVSNTTQTNADTAPLFQTDESKFGGSDSNRALPDNAAQ